MLSFYKRIRLRVSMNSSGDSGTGVYCRDLVEQLKQVV